MKHDRVRTAGRWLLGGGLTALAAAAVMTALRRSPWAMPDATPTEPVSWSSSPAPAVPTPPSPPAPPVPPAATTAPAPAAAVAAAVDGAVADDTGGPVSQGADGMVSAAVEMEGSAASAATVDDSAEGADATGAIGDEADVIEEAAEGEGWATPTDGACPATHPIKGNVSSNGGDRIYHVPGSANYERTTPERCFASVEAAEADGFRAPRHG